jgi:hypothetical protein
MKSQDSLSIGFDSLLFHPSGDPYGEKGKITATRQKERLYTIFTNKKK